jgi:hypothetical protein
MRQIKYLNYLLFFLVSPLLSLFISIKSYRNAVSKNIVWLFCTFFGYCIELDFLGGTNDAIVYVNRFYFFHDNQITIDYLFSIFLSNRNHIEIVGDLISFFVAQFTRDYHFLYATFGFFFGYFQSRNLNYALTKIQDSKYNFAWLACGFLLSIPIWNVNGFDFWFATQVYIYIIIRVILDHKYKLLLSLAILPFIHFSFLFLIIITLFLFVFIRFEKAVFVLFYFSLFSVFFDFTILFQFLDFLPEIFSSRTSAYLNADLSEREGGRIISLFNNIFNLSIYLTILFLTKKYYKILSEEKYVLQFILFSFAFTGFFNLISDVPSVGRFIYVGMSFMWISLMLIIWKIEKDFQFNNKLIGFLKILLLMAFCLNILRYVFPLVGMGKFFSNAFTIYFFLKDDVIIGNFL